MHYTPRRKLTREFKLEAVRQVALSEKPKALNRRDFLLLGTLLAVIREKNVRITQPRFGSVNEIDPR